MTAYELRLHLRRQHDLYLIGLDYAALLAIHDDDHQGGTAGHEHDDGPGSTTWAAECRDFGCDDTGATRVAVLEYIVLAGVVFLAAWLYVLAGR